MFFFFFCPIFLCFSQQQSTMVKKFLSIHLFLYHQFFINVTSSLIIKFGPCKLHLPNEYTLHFVDELIKISLHIDFSHSLFHLIQLKSLIRHTTFCFLNSVFKFLTPPISIFVCLFVYIRRDINIYYDNSLISFLPILYHGT